MSLKYTIEMPQDGSQTTIDVNRVQSDLNKVGIPSYFSPDGTTATIVFNGQEMEGPVKDLISQYYGPVKSILPEETKTDFSTVSNRLKSGIAQFSSDSLKAKYLQIAMQNIGFEDAKIVGSGDDWFRFDPGTGTYAALTNRPGAELSDILTYAPEAARTIGSVIGGIAGAGAGGGWASVATGAAGSAIGGTAGQKIGKVLQSTFDKDFAQTLGKLSSEELNSIVKEDLARLSTDALIGGAVGVPIKAVQNAVNKGILSRLGSTVGRTAESTGKSIETIARQVGTNDIARTAAIQLGTPTLGAVQAAGFLAKAPQWLTTRGLDFAGKAPQWLSQKGVDLSSKYAQVFGQKGAQLVKNSAERFKDSGKIFQNLNQPYGNRAMDKAEAGLKMWQNAFNKTKDEVTPQARDSLGTLGQRIGDKITSSRLLRAKNAYDNLIKSMPEPAKRTAAQRAKLFEVENTLEKIKNAQINYGKIGADVGRFFDASHGLGEVTEKTVDNAAKAAFKGAELSGIAANYAGRTIRMGSQFMQPLEVRGALQGSRIYAEEQLPWARKNRQ